MGPIQSPEVEAWATGFPIALLHIAVALAILVAAGALYALLSPSREIGLIRDGNSAAALSFGGVLLGLGLPLAFALGASRSVLEVALWGVSVTALALALFWLTDTLLQGLPQRVREGDVPAAALLTAAKLAVAAILCAAVTG